MNALYKNFLKLKSDSGLHSPSIFELKNDLKVDIEIDACFLCNPYAFELFLSNFKYDSTLFSVNATISK